MFAYSCTFAGWGTCPYAFYVHHAKQRLLHANVCCCNEACHAISQLGGNHTGSWCNVAIEDQTRTVAPVLVKLRFGSSCCWPYWKAKKYL